MPDLKHFNHPQAGFKYFPPATFCFILQFNRASPMLVFAKLNFAPMNRL
jgi:hypothetical protein